VSRREWFELRCQYRWRCAQCGTKHRKSPLTRDHYIPRSKGGSSDISNIQPLCGPCNQKKGDQLPVNAFPVRPKPRPCSSLAGG
jgi:5-methylcytosine-specific restriction endonuclease McrA